MEEDEMTDQPKPQLHATDLGMLSLCPMQYHYRRVEGIIAPPGIAAIAGSGTHAGVEHSMRHKMETSELADLEAVQEVAKDAVNARWEEGVHLTDEDQTVPETKLRGQVVDKAVRLTSLHHKQLAPVIMPTQVERKWVVELDGYPMDLAGMIDLQEEHSLRDTKTAAKKPPAKTANVSQQITMYCLAASIIDGEIPEECWMDNLVDTKTPKVHSMRTTRDEEDVQILLRRVEAAIELIEGGKFYPCDPSHWICDPKWCGYFERCPYSRHPVNVAV
jgi:hypothetical protein